MFLARNMIIEKEMSLIGKVIRSCSTDELLGITSDKNLNFKTHIENICCKANNKKFIFGIQSFLTLEQAEVLAEAYRLSNFRYCPLVLMLCGKGNNNLIMKTQYRCLFTCYLKYTNKDVLWLTLNGKIDIYTQNIQILITEIYKCLNKISLPFTWD